MRRRFGGPAGFSLVEILISVMILGIGMVMVAGAFPVGLRYFQDATDETTAGHLARSMLSSLQAMRTRAYEAYEQKSEGNARAEPWSQAAVVECFRTDTEEVVYLWDDTTHNSSGPGKLLADQGLGSSIDDWMPREERISGVDDRFSCQVFYKLVSDPLGHAPIRSGTYEVFIAVQKAPEMTGVTDWSALFPPPSGVTTVTGSGTSVTWPASSAFTVRAGALLVNVDGGDWAEVVEVSGATLRLSRAIGGTRVRAINNCVAMFRGIVSKEAVR